MADLRRPWTEHEVEQIVGNLLRVGVLLAAAVVLLGGVLYLTEYGRGRVNYGRFQSEPADLRSPVGVVKLALAGDSRGLIQVGLLLLVATPVARVVFSVYAFARQYDWLYVGVTLLVLGVLLYSLFHGEL
jgi:uncharacterized membrane protein